jgi:hypothetical protein
MCDIKVLPLPNFGVLLINDGNRKMVNEKTKTKKGRT